MGTLFASIVSAMQDQEINIVERKDHGKSLYHAVYSLANGKQIAVCARTRGQVVRRVLELINRATSVDSADSDHSDLLPHEPRLSKDEVDGDPDSLFFPNRFAQSLSLAAH